VDVDFCAELNRYLVEKIENSAVSHQPSDLDYSLEVGSVSLTDPFKAKMQFEKNLGHDVEVLVVESRKSKDRPADSKTVKYRGQLVSVDEETFSVDCEEKVKVSTKGQSTKYKGPKMQIVTHTWRYDEPKYVRYDLKF
jgi:ribosome maturation factor RimP